MVWAYGAVVGATSTAISPSVTVTRTTCRTLGRLPHAPDDDVPHAVARLLDIVVQVPGEDEVHPLRGGDLHQGLVPALQDARVPRGVERRVVECDDLGRLGGGLQVGGQPGEFLVADDAGRGVHHRHMQGAAVEGIVEGRRAAVGEVRAVLGDRVQVAGHGVHGDRRRGDRVGVGLVGGLRAVCGEVAGVQGDRGPPRGDGGERIAQFGGGKGAPAQDGQGDGLGCGGGGGLRRRGGRGRGGRGLGRRGGRGRGRGRHGRRRPQGRARRRRWRQGVALRALRGQHGDDQAADHAGHDDDAQQPEHGVGPLARGSFHPPSLTRCTG